MPLSISPQISTKPFTLCKLTGGGRDLLLIGFVLANVGTGEGEGTSTSAG